MNIKIQFTDEANKQAIILENKEKFLIEEQNITEGNFLIFSDVISLEKQMIDLQTNQTLIKNTLFDMINI